MAQLIYAIDGDLTGLANTINQAIGLIKQLDSQSGKIKFGSEGLQTLPATLANISSGINQVKASADSANVSLSFVKGVQALDQLGSKLAVITGNSILFGDSLKVQEQELAAYQGALNKLLALGFAPLDADVTLLKTKIDDLTASIAAQNAVAVKSPTSLIVDKTQFTEPLKDVPTDTTALSGAEVLIRDLNADLAAGKITATEYAASMAFIGQETSSTSIKLEQEAGILAGLKSQLDKLKTAKVNIADPADLAKQNRLIQELEAEIGRLNNVGKTGFDAAGNSVQSFGKNIDNTRTPVENLGKGLTRGFGYLRQIAFILPGIGIAGIFNLAFEGIAKAADALEIFNQKLSTSQKNLINLNEVAVDAGKQFGKQSENLKILYKAATDVNNAEHDRILAARELQKEFPDTFRNIQIETILNGGASASYQQLTKDILDNAKARAALSKIQELAGKQLEDEIKIQTSLRALANKNARTLPVTQISRAGETQLLNPKEQEATVKAQREANNAFTAESIKKINLDKQSLQEQIDFLTKFAGGNNAIAKSLAIKDTPKAKDTTDFFQQLLNQLDQLIAKSNALAASTGLTGYAAEVQKIGSEFAGINTALDNLQKKTNIDLNKGRITPVQAAALTNGIKTTQGQLTINEQRSLDAARVSEATKTANDLQSIDDAFGVKQEQSRKKELAAVQKLANDKIAAIQTGVFTQQQIQDQFNASVSAAKGNKDQIKTAELVRDAEIQTAQDAATEVIRIHQGVLTAQDTINQKYLEKERQLESSITDLQNQALDGLSNKETNATNKIVAGWDKRKTEAAKYFDQLRVIYPELSAIITKQQNSTNALFDAAKFNDVSVQLSKNFAGAMQSGITTFVQDFFTSITTLGQQRQSIDDKYRSQYASATDALTKQQIAQQEQIEKSATTSFGAIFSSLVSSAFSSFNKSILDSFTKKFTENIGATLIKPNSDQLGIQASGQQFSGEVTSAAQSFSSIINSAAEALSLKLNPATSGIQGLSGSLGADNTELAASSAGGQFAGSVSAAGDTFNGEIDGAASSFSNNVVSASTEAATNTTAAATNAAGHLSSAAAGIAAAASIAGGLISGLGKPTNSVTSALGGALQGAGEGALIGSVIPGVGTVAGAAIGGLIGGISGLFSASKAKKQEELAQKQLEQQQQTNALLARQNALAYTSSIIGRMTTQGIVTSADINSFGELTATVSGKSLQFVLGRTNNGR